MTNQEPEPNSSDENPVVPPTGPIAGKVVVPVGKMRSSMWVIVVLSGMLCGFFFATSLFGFFGSTSVTMFGCLATFVLAATLFSLSKNDVILVDRKEVPAKEESVTEA